MNILFVHNWIKLSPEIVKRGFVEGKPVGGKNTNMWRYIEAFSTNSDVEAHVITEPIKNYPTVEQYNNIYIHHLSGNKIWRRFHQTQQLAKQIVEKHNIQAIFYDFTPLNYMYLSIVPLLKLNIPIIAHTDFDFFRWDVPIQKKLLHKCRALHTLTEIYKQHFIRHGFNNVHVIPSPINTTHYSPSADSGKFREKHGLNNKTIITYVRGRDLLAEQFIKKVTPYFKEVMFCFVGGFNFPAIRRDNILFTGVVPQNELIEIIATSDLCLSSEEEFGSLPLSTKLIFYMGIEGLLQRTVECTSLVTRLMEYSACATPTLAVRSKAITNAFQEEKEVFLVNNRKKDWINVIRNLLKNPELMREVGINARKRVEKNYSYEPTANKMIEMFKSAMK